MPVILHSRDFDRWLNDYDESRPPLDLLRPYESDKMRMTPANRLVGNVRNNGPEMLNSAIPDVTVGGGSFDDLASCEISPGTAKPNKATKESRFRWRIKEMYLLLSVYPQSCFLCLYQERRFASAIARF